MLTLPLPLIVALNLGFLAIRRLSNGDRFGLFLGLLLVCALQSLIVALTQHYGVTGLRAVQPVTATLAPVLAWLSFQSSARARHRWRRSGSMGSALCLSRSASRLRRNSSMSPCR